MKSTAFGEVILSEQDVVNGLYSGKITSLEKVFLDNPELCKVFNESVRKNADRVALCKVWSEPTETMQEWDKKNQEQWFMPREYAEMDIELFLLEQCTSAEEQDRVALELDLYHRHNFISVLKYLKYLVDTMRSNNIVWGVGRGSSVASYCLYLLGVHKVNSIKYELDIHEFLK
jgi:DNA polymerase III alpha subunit